MVASVQIPHKVWVEIHDDEHNNPQSCDVIVKVEDGTLYTAQFVTLPYLQRQMELSYTVSAQLENTPPVRYAALDSPHILVDDLSRDIIEDTIDNLIALDVFEGLFTQITEDEVENTLSESRTSNGTGTRATQEVAAVVLSDVLVVSADD